VTIPTTRNAKKYKMFIYTDLIQRNKLLARYIGGDTTIMRSITETNDKMFLIKSINNSDATCETTMLETK